MAHATAIRRLAPAAAARVDRLLARSDAYRMLAAALRDPDGPEAGTVELDELVAMAAQLGISLSSPEREAMAAIVDRDRRATEHRRLFGHTVAHGCPPYEMEYGPRHVFGQAQELADLAGFYAAFGLRPAASGERVDHLACELEFTAVLTLKEAYAVASRLDEEALVAGQATASFLRDHLARWAPAVAALAARRAPGGGLTALLALAGGLVSAHAGDLGVSPERFGPDDLRPIDDELEQLAPACGPIGIDPEPPG